MPKPKLEKLIADVRPANVGNCAVGLTTAMQSFDPATQRAALCMLFNALIRKYEASPANVTQAGENLIRRAWDQVETRAAVMYVQQQL